MDSYYHSHDLGKFGEMGKGNKELWDKFMSYYSAVFAEGALGLPFGVDVCRIEEIDAELECVGDEPCRLAPVHLRAQREPRAEGEFADSQAAAAQCARSHGAQSSRSIARDGRPRTVARAGFVERRW